MCNEILLTITLKYNVWGSVQELSGSGFDIPLFPNFLLFPLVRTMYSFIVSYNAPVSLLFESADNFTNLPFKYQSKFQVGISEYLLLLA